jgi:hypothetical protein
VASCTAIHWSPPEMDEIGAADGCQQDSADPVATTITMSSGCILGRTGCTGDQAEPMVTWPAAGHAFRAAYRNCLKPMPRCRRPMLEHIIERAVGRLPPFGLAIHYPHDRGLFRHRDRLKVRSTISASNRRHGRCSGAARAAPGGPSW